MKTILVLLIIVFALLKSGKASPLIYDAKDMLYRQMCRCSKNITHTNGGTYTLILTYEVSSNTTCSNWEGASGGWLVITFMGLAVADGLPSQYAFENICGPNTIPVAKK
jgi:hypothetical protein